MSAVANERASAPGAGLNDSDHLKRALRVLAQERGLSITFERFGRRRLFTFCRIACGTRVKDCGTLVKAIAWVKTQPLR